MVRVDKTGSAILFVWLCGL